MLATRLVGATSAAAAANIEYVGGYVQGFDGTTSNRTIFIDDLLGGLASAPADGDLVIVYFGTASATINRNLVVDTYTEIGDYYVNASRSANLVVAYKFMGATPDVSLTLTGGTLSTADAGAVAVQVWRGVNQTTPFDVTETTSFAGQGDINPPSISPVTNGAVVVAGAAAAHGTGTQTFSSSNLTDFISVGRNDTNDVTVGVGYHYWTSGSFDPAAFGFSGTIGSSFSSRSVTLALRPA